MAKKKFNTNKAQTMLSPENYIRTRARSLPIYECLISQYWKESGLATVLISRRQPSGNLIVGVYLVDLFCLGLKNSKYFFNISLSEYEEECKGMVFKEQTIEACDYVLAHNIIYGAIEYADDLGFKPNKEFALTKFILNKDEDVEVLEDLEFGKDGIPFYITGPYDNVNFIINRLNNAVGEGNYHIDDDDEEEEEEEEEYMNSAYKDYKEDNQYDEFEPYNGITKKIDKESGKEMLLMEYSISYDRMNDPTHEKFILEFGESKLEELHHLALKKPKKSIAILKQLITKHSNAPVLYNYLAVALEKCKLFDESSMFVKYTYENFPGYLFGKINYMTHLIKEGKTDEVCEIMENKFTINLQYPHRKTFHISEVSAFLTMTVSYFIAIGKIEVAESHFKFLKSIEPNHKHIKRLKLEFAAAKFKNLFRVQP